MAPAEALLLARPLALKELHRLPVADRVPPEDADRESTLLAEAQLLPLAWLLSEDSEEGLELA